jgi:hypothetical protein
MGNLLRSISAFIGGRADLVPARSPAQTAAAHSAAASQTTAVAPDTASHDDVVEPCAHSVDEPSRAPARDLPLVPYANAHDAMSPQKARRSRAVSLMRSAASSAVTTRTVPTLPSVATRPPLQPGGPLLTQTERLRLQVMQTQLQLSVLRLYEGPIDGNMNAATATAVRHFQTLKGFRATGTLAAGTLAALGVPPIA